MREFSPCSCLIALPCPAWVLLSKICIPFCRSLYSVPNSSGYDRFITAKSTRPIAIGNISKSSHYSNERRQVWSECPIWLSDVKRYHLSLPRIAHCRPLCCPDTLRYERETEGGGRMAFVVRWKRGGWPTIAAVWKFGYFLHGDQCYTNALHCLVNIGFKRHISLYRYICLE